MMGKEEEVQIRKRKVELLRKKKERTNKEKRKSQRRNSMTVGEKERKDLQIKKKTDNC